MKLNAKFTAYDVRSQTTGEVLNIPLTVRVSAEGYKATSKTAIDENTVQVTLESVTTLMQGSGVNASLVTDILMGGETIQLVPTVASKEILTNLYIAGISIGGSSESSTPVSIDIDSELSETSENPVQNKVVTIAIKDKTSKNDVSEMIEEALEDYTPASNNEPMLQEEYDSIESKEAKLYFIWDEEEELQKIYFGELLVAKRGEVGGDLGFPYTFPIIFC